MKCLVLVLTFSVALYATPCPWNKLFLSSPETTTNEIAEHYLNILKQLGPEVLTKENTEALLKSGSPFSIPESVKAESNTLSETLSEFETLLGEKFNLEEVKRECLKKLKTHSERAQNQKSQQKHIETREGLELKVIKRSSENYSQSSNSIPNQVTLNGVPYLTYFGYQTEGAGPRVALNLHSGKVHKLELSSKQIGDLRATPIRISGKDYYLMVGRKTYVINADHQEVTPKFQPALDKIQNGGAITSTISLDGTEVFASVLHSGENGNRTEIVVYDPEKGIRKSLFETDSPNAELADIKQTSSGTYLALGSIWKEYVELVRIAPDNTLTRKAINTNRETDIGAAKETKLFETNQGEVGMVFRGEKDTTTLFNLQGKLINLPIPPGLQFGPEVHQYNGRPVAVTETGGKHNPLNPQSYGWASVIDLEKQTLLKKIPTPHRFTGVSSFKEGNKIYLTWGTTEGKVALMEINDAEPIFSQLLNPYWVQSVTPFKQDGNWNAAVLFSSDYTKKHHGPVIIRLK